MRLEGLYSFERMYEDREFYEEYDEDGFYFEDPNTSIELYQDHHLHVCPLCGAISNCDDPWCISPAETECYDCLIYESDVGERYA